MLQVQQAGIAMTTEQLKELRDHAWKHFALHADQRLKTFNFYLVLATVISGGLLTVLKDLKSPALGIPFAVLLTILSFIFWRLDVRTKHLIWHAEEALKYWEDQQALPECNNCPHVAKVFRKEEHETRMRKRFGGVLPGTGYYSYSRCFNTIFVLFAFIGLLVTLLLITTSVDARSTCPTSRPSQGSTLVTVG